MANGRRPVTVPGVTTRTSALSPFSQRGIRGFVPGTSVRPNFGGSPFPSGPPIGFPQPRTANGNRLVPNGGNGGFPGLGGTSGPCAHLTGAARTVCEAGGAAVSNLGEDCPRGTRNTRGRISTAILGPNCEPVGDPTGDQPVLPGTRVPVPTGVPGSGALPTVQDPGVPSPGAIGSAPFQMQTVRRQCPRGPTGKSMVLAIDGRCYPKPMVPKRFRLHPPRPKPVVSRADQKAIRRADRAKKRLVKLTKQAGAHASMSKPRRRARSRKKC